MTDTPEKITLVFLSILREAKELTKAEEHTSKSPTFVQVQIHLVFVIK